MHYMGNTMKVSSFVIVCASRAVVSAFSFNTNDYPAGDIITRDVAVIGGGSAGTYGAINLRLLNQSVVLVEKEGLLGGHVNTYTDPTTGTTVDYGVQAFWNISVARDYFAHFDISTAVWTEEYPNTVYANFETGEQVTVVSGDNYTGYEEQLEKYPWLIYSWNFPDPVPKDLISPFYDFVEKYSLEDIAFGVYFAAQGLANVLQELTVNVFKYFDQSFIDALAGGDIVTANHDNAEIYTKALAELGSDVLLSSTIVAADRPANGSGVRLVVETPSGNRLIEASKLLVAIPPLLSNMDPFNLDATEASLFSHWNYSAFYVGLLNNTGLPAGYRFVNAVASNATFNIPSLPATYQITETAVPGLFYFWYGSPYALTQAEVEADVTAAVKQLQLTANSTTTSTPHFVEYKSHTPFKLTVSAEEITDGFYKNLEALQGHRNTWYTGGAWISQSSSIIWNYTQQLLPQIVAA